MSKKLVVRKEVQLFRDSIGKLVALLTSRKIRVTESGKRAYCIWDAKGTLLRINLPVVPDNANDRLLFAMHGYTDHEVAHVLYTDPLVSERLKGAGAHHVWNVIEDIYIERRMSAVFLGSRRNLYKVHAHILESVFEKEAKPALLASRDDRKTFIHMFLMPACRALAGHPGYQEFMEPFWEAFPRETACLESIRFADRIAEVSCSADCVVLAADLLKALAEDRDSEESGDEPSDMPGEGPGAPGEAGDSDDGDMMPHGDDDPDAKPEPFPDREMTEDDIKRLMESEAMDSMGVEEAASRLISDEVDAVEHGTYLPYTRDYDFKGRLEDFPDYLASHPDTDKWRHGDLGNYRVETKSGLYYFRTNIEPLLDGKLSTLAKEMERAVASQNRTQYIPGRRQGQLHGASLFRLSMNDDRVFRKKEVRRALNACVQIVVDMSGSMGGTNIEMAMASAWALSDALDKIRVPNIVTGFTTSGEITGARESSRSEALLMPVLKDWAERANTDIVRARCGKVTNYPLSNNVDGECLMALSSHLMCRTEDRKIMLVLSDGEPAAVAKGLEAHLRQVTAYIEKQLGFDLLGIGIRTDAPSRYYSRSVKINSVGDLPATVAGALRRILVEGHF